MWKTTVEPAKPRKNVRFLPIVRVLEMPDERAPRRWVFEGGEVAVGRAVGERGLAFPDDDAVSRQHAVLHIDVASRSASIEDTSRSGTFVQGQRVAKGPVREGDVVRVGNSFFALRFEAENEIDGAETSEKSALIGDSPALRTIRRTLSVVAKSPATVLVLGESGTGKELAAQQLHAQSERPGPFVAVNCGAIPEALAESQLFGHLPGAFTGAKRETLGWFQAASSGTLFLDELGELPLSLQPKLLRAVEERAVVPVGATTPVPCDVRIVAATNRDLGDRSRFRGDLLARVSEFVVEIPPLRERREDVLPILASMLGEQRAELDPELVGALLLHDYPHNARDLRRIATQLSVRGRDRELWDLSLVDRLGEPEAEGEEASAQVRAVERAPAAASPIPTREELEALLKVHSGNVADMARETGRSRKQVYRWLVQHGLSLDDYRRD
jgi:transcriptional regulator with PAS, ATPase and Fis domain